MTEDAARVVAGRYRLVQAVGRGGMGTVWRAHDVLLGRDVAVKEIWFPGAGHDSDDPLAQRALREAQAAARLRHPGVVTVHDVVIEQGRPWLVMELINGRSLAQAVEDHGLLTERRTAEIGLLVLDALRAAHRAGITHRDVKPANILLDDADRVVLTDFGIAMIDDATALTATGQMVGSPAYLAPERINGQPASAASDLWSLGVTLYTVVTGRSPFQRGDTQATLAAVLTARPTAPAHAGRLWPVIKGLLAKDPARRLTAEQARVLLTTVVERDAATGQVTAWRRPRWWPGSPKGPSGDPDGTPVTVGAPSPTLAAPTDHRQRPEPAAALPTGSATSVSDPAAPAPVEAGASTVGAPDQAITAVDGLAPHAGAGEQPGTADVTAVRSTGRSRRSPPRNRILAGVLAFALIIAGVIGWQRHSDGTAARQKEAAAERIAAAAREKESAAAQPTVLSRSLAAEATSIRTTDPERAALLALYAYHNSPTSEAIASLHSVTTRTLTITGRAPELNIDGVGTVAYSPDGRHLAGGSSLNPVVRIWDLNTGIARDLKVDAGHVSGLVYSPDGRRIAGAGSDGKVRIWDVNTGVARTYKGHTGGGVGAIAYSPEGRHVASGGWDDTVRIWDLNTGTARTLRGHTSGVIAMAYSPDGRHLASGSWDETVRIWDLNKGTARTLKGHTSAVTTMAYSPDGRHLATAGYDRTVRIWDLNKGTARTLKGHTDPVNAVAYSPDGRHLASGSADSTVRIWDLTTGAARTLAGHTGYVFEVAYSNDGQVASGGQDNTVRLWSDDMTPAAMVAHICRGRHRDLTAAERATYRLPPTDDTPVCP
jgi:serine/threonine protein kinase